MHAPLSICRCAPNQDVRKLQYFEVGFASGQWMAMAKALGIPVVRGCEVQRGEGMRTLMHVGFASQVANLGGVFDATYRPIEDPEVQLWRHTDDANYDQVGAAALYTFSFDVGKSAAAASMMIPCHALLSLLLLLLLCTAIWYLMSTPADDLPAVPAPHATGFTDEGREAIYHKVGSCPRASMLLTCRAQGAGSLFTTPQPVLEQLQEAGQEMGKTWEYMGYIALPMRGSGERKTGWVFADTSGVVAVPMEFGWLAA